MGHIGTRRSREGAPLPDATPAKEPPAQACFVSGRTRPEHSRMQNTHRPRTDELITYGVKSLIFDKVAFQSQGIRWHGTSGAWSGVVSGAR